MTDDDTTIALDEAGEVTLPIVDVLTGRGFITGKSGSGKSNTASVVIEELLNRGYPVMIVDTDGEYWGLKQDYEILHVGADEECDLQVGPEHAGKLAELALEQNVPIILDVSGYLDRDEADELILNTSRELFTREKDAQKPFLLLVEEVHEYIPEQGSGGDVGKMLVRIGKRGRKRGLGLVGMSQRPADVDKDFISQADWLVWHRLTWDNDTKVVRRMLGTPYDDEIRDLADGEGFLEADFLDEDLTRVQVRRKHTFDAGATPGLEDYERPELQSVSGDLVGELEEISSREERRQDRIAELEAKLQAKEEELAEKERELENARDVSSAASQFAQALQGGVDSNGHDLPEDFDEQLEEKNNRIAELEDEVQALEAELAKREERVEELEAELEGRPNLDERAQEAVEVLASEFGVGGEDSETLRRKLKSARERIEELEESGGRAPPEMDVLEHPAVQRQVKNLKGMVDDLGEKQLKMLEWFQFYGPGEVGDAYFHAGYKRSSKRKHEAAKPLKQAGFIEEADGRGEYRYTLDERVREEFEENPQIGEDDIAAIVAKVEDHFQDLAADAEP